MRLSLQSGATGLLDLVETVRWPLNLGRTGSPKGRVPHPRYDYRQIDPVAHQDGGAPGGNIRVGFLFRTDRRLEFVDRGEAGPLDATGVVATRHGHTEIGPDGRHQQAARVNEFVRDLLAADKQARVIVLGNINDFDFSETVDILESGGTLMTLFDLLPQNEQYSYDFEGNSQVLDQILVSRSLLHPSPEYDSVHMNAEFADQTSDHDPQVARLNISGRNDTANAASAPRERPERPRPGECRARGHRDGSDGSVLLASTSKGNRKATMCEPGAVHGGCAEPRLTGRTHNRCPEPTAG